MTYKIAVYLIKWVPIRQKERWARLKRWHNLPNSKMSTRHYFMQREIYLIRQQNELLKQAKAILQ